MDGGSRARRARCQGSHVLHCRHARSQSGLRWRRQRRGSTRRAAGDRREHVRSDLTRGDCDRPRGLRDLALHTGRARPHARDRRAGRSAQENRDRRSRAALRLARVHLRRARLRRGRADRARKGRERDHRADSRLAGRQVDRRGSRSLRDRRRDLEPVPRAVPAVPGRSEGGADKRWRAPLVHHDRRDRPCRSRSGLRDRRCVHRPCRMGVRPEGGDRLRRCPGEACPSRVRTVPARRGAAGLFAYGLFCLVQARYREV